MSTDAKKFKSAKELCQPSVEQRLADLEQAVGVAYEGYYRGIAGEVAILRKCVDKLDNRGFLTRIRRAFNALMGR